MGSDDLTTFEDDLELDDTDESDGEDDFTDLDLDDEKPAARQQTQAKVKQAFDKERQAAQKREAALMGSLEAWAGEALAQFPLADVASIGLTGIDGAAKEKFLTEVKAQHEAREHALAEAGYVRLDGEGKPIEPAGGGRLPRHAGRGQHGRGRAPGRTVLGQAALGHRRPGQHASPGREGTDGLDEAGPKAVIDLMFKRNPGLTDWIKRK